MYMYIDICDMYKYHTYKYIYIYIYIYIWYSSFGDEYHLYQLIRLHSCDYLNKISIKNKRGD